MGYSICLDAGHQSYPNSDTGCSGFGLHEEDIVLDICKRAKTLIELNGIKVIMTRDGAKVNGDGSSLNASLNTRCQIANVNKTYLFLSVHCDAFNSQAFGTTVHVFGLNGNAERFAKILNPMMGKLFYNRGIKASNFAVIRDTNMPAVLLETAFLDNKDDNAKLADPNVRQQIAVSIAKSVCVYFFGTDYVYKEKSTQTIKSTINNNQGEDNVLEKAVLLYSKDDYFAGGDVALKYNCAIFIRPSDKSCPHEAFLSKQLYVIGGSSVKHPNEILLSGNNKFDTCAEVNKFLG